MPMVTMRYWAAAKQAAGVAEEAFSAATLEEALAAARSSRQSAPEFAKLLARSSILVDGEQAGRQHPSDVALHDGAIIEILPPFAGG